MKSHRSAIAVFALTALFVDDPVTSQRGRRREAPPEVKERWGNYFTTVELPENEAKAKDRLLNCEHVKNATAAGHLSLLYLFDSTTEVRKRQAFQQAIFNHNKINPGLRLFKCGMIDLANDRLTRNKYGTKAPLFFVFDKKGKLVAQVSMKGFHAAPVPLVQHMRQAVRGYSKLTFDGWVKRYWKFIREISMFDSRKRTLESRARRLEDRPKQKKQLEKIQRDQDALQKETEKHFAKEQRMLEMAKVPPRDPKAKLVGEPRRRR